MYEIQVREDAQGRGVGQRLMATLEALVACMRVKRLGLCVFRFNEPALAFYQGPAG